MERFIYKNDFSRVMPLETQTRREFLSRLGKGAEKAGKAVVLLSLPAILTDCAGNEATTSNQKSSNSVTNLTYKVLDAYRDLYNQAVVIQRSDNKVYIIEREVWSDGKVGSIGVIEGNQKPDQLFGYTSIKRQIRDGLYSLEYLPFNNQDYKFAANVFNAEVGKVTFKDFRPLEPERKLNDKEYEKNYSMEGLNFQARKSGNFIAGISQRVKYAVGLEPKEHVVFVTNGVEFPSPVIYDETTGREFYLKGTLSEGLKNKAMSKLPDILKKLNVKGKIAVSADLLENDQIPSNYKNSFKNIQTLGTDYKVVVFNR